MEMRGKKKGGSKWEKIGWNEDKKICPFDAKKVCPVTARANSVGKTTDINTVTQSVRIVCPLFFCPFSAEYTANQAAGFTMKSAAFFV